MITTDQIASAEEEVIKLEQSMEDRLKQIELIKIGYDMDKDKVKAIRKGIEKLKAKSEAK